MLPRPTRRFATRCALLAAGAYMLLTLAVLRPVLPAPQRLLPFPAAHHLRGPALVRLDHSDQAMVVATVARNADRLTSAPWRLREGGQCHPMPRSYTLGEHMFGLGLLAAPAHALGAEPILAYNVALWATLWIPALTMYALAVAVTGSAPAAFVAGLAFALQPGRLADPTHPYVHGDLWAPLALLFLYRLLRGGGLWPSLGLGLCVALEVGESLYSLLATLIYLAVYAVAVGVRAPRRLLRAAPGLVGAAAVAGGAAWLVLGPYLDTRATWGVLTGRSGTFASWALFAPAADHFPGWLVLVLVVAALVDRLRGARGDDDLRLPMLAGALIVLWCALGKIHLPGLGVALPSPLQMARGWVPGLDAVRALQVIALSLGVATSLLVAYGVVALLARVGRRRAIWITVALSLAIVAARLYGPLARASFGRTLRLEAWDARPPQDDVDLVQRAGPGAILDVPLPYREGHIAFGAGDALLRAAYGPRDSAACYNSFGSPLQKQVWLLSEDLPEPSAVDALAALGFGTVLAHGPAEMSRMAQDRSPMRERGVHSASLAAFAIPPSGAVSEDFALLAAPLAGSPATPALHAPAGRARVVFELRNGGPVTFRHPPPFAPSDLVVRWTPLDARAASATSTSTSSTRALLPIALGPGGELPVDVDVELPAPPGRYRAALSRAAEPRKVLAVRDVVVEPGATAEAADALRNSPVDVLQPAPAPEVRRVVEGRRLISFTVANPGPGPYRNLDARGVLRLRVIWRSPDGSVAREDERSVRVPPALPAGVLASVDVPLRTPAPGRYRVDLVTTEPAPHVLGVLEVEVVDRAAAVR